MCSYFELLPSCDARHPPDGVVAKQFSQNRFGQRETLKATDATVAIAKAAGRPQVSATVGLNRTLTESGLLINGGKGPTVSAGVDLSYGKFINNIVDFLIVAIAIFVVIKLMNTAARKKPAPSAEPPPLTLDQQLLTDIRDQLKTSQRTA